MLCVILAHILDFVVNSKTNYYFEMCPSHFCALAEIFFLYWLWYTFNMTDLEFDVNCFQGGGIEQNNI